MSAGKYFAIGFAFYLFTSFLFSLTSLGSDFVYLPLGIQTSVVIAIGLLKGPTNGLAFGSSKLFVNIVFLFYYWYIYSTLFSLSIAVAVFLSSIIVAIPYMIYGYLPAKLYKKRSKIIFGFIGFFIAVLINLFLFLLIYGFEQYPIIWLSNSFLWVFILGNLSIAISFIKLKVEKKLPIEVTELSRFEIELPVEEAKQEDIGKGIARINPKAMQMLGVNAGDIIEIIGSGVATATVWPAYEDNDKDIIRLDEITRKNVGVTINSNVVVKKAKIEKALYIAIVPTETRLNVDENFTNFVKNRLINKNVVEGNIIPIAMLGHTILFKVLNTNPKGAVKVVDSTKLEILEFFEEPVKQSTTILKLTERHENLTPTYAESRVEHEMMKEEKSQQLYGVLILPDKNELHVSLKRVIGRDDLAKYVPPEKAWWISKQHILIYQEGGTFYIEDNQSTNGTKLNGMEIRNMGKQKLNDNDEIIVADLVKILFKIKNSNKF